MEEGAAILDKETANQSEEVSMKIGRLEAELSSAMSKSAQLEESEGKVRQELLEQAKQVKEAQEKYERELMQHAADVEQLNSIRELLEERKDRLGFLQQTVARLEEELSSARSSWHAQKEMLEKEATEKSKRCAELDKEVDIMQQQIVTLSTRMAAVTRVQETALK